MSITVNQSSLMHSFSSFSIAPDESINRRSVANISAKTPKTPKLSNISGIRQIKTPKTPMGHDRFIPNRSALNVDVSHYLVTRSDASMSKDEPNPRANPSDIRFNTRVLPFGERSISTAPDSSFSKSSKKTRAIPKVPDKVLDAPNVKNDFYLQLIDWSENNLLAVALGKELYVWNAITNETINLLTLPEEQFVSSVSWVKGSKNNIAVGTSNADIQIWDTNKCQRLRKMTGHAARISTLDWNKHILTSGCRSGSIFHHDVRVDKHHVGTLKGHSHEVCGLKWSASGQYLASGGNDNIVNLWSKDVNSEKPIYTFTDHKAAVKAIAWSPWKTNLLATGGGSADKCIKIWNSYNGENLHTVDTEAQVSGLMWSKENYQELVSAHGVPKNNLLVWKYPELSKIGEMPGHSERILGASLSPDGKTVVSLGADEALRFWECFPVDLEKKKKDELKINVNNSLHSNMR